MPADTTPRVRQPEADGEPSGPEDLIGRAAEGRKLKPEQAADALDWLLSEDPEEEGEVTHTIEINVGSPAKPHWVPWTIRPVEIETLRRIGRESGGSRAVRRAGGQADATVANLRIIVEGTVDPDVAAYANQKGIADPAVALRLRFKKKPGLVGQIAGEIMSLSGFDEEDVRDAREVKAAGN